jgi:hypothetical protein
MDRSAPNDAFEVALRDASGHSVVGTAGLSHTDALLNIQANGTAYAGANVYLKGNLVGNGNALSLSGPMRFAVDLSGVADGTVLTLDFDLLGLGDVNSRVRIDDVGLRPNLNSEPVATDDAVTTAEDSTLTVAVLANDVDPESDALAVMALAGPKHPTQVTIHRGGNRLGRGRDS